MTAANDRAERWRRHWDKSAPSYDRTMGVCERLLLWDSRDWVCSRASGEVLEVAIGTGLNLAFYPGEIALTGIEWSPAMLSRARQRSGELGRETTLLEGDARSLPFPAESFDTVVCTFSLCAIPDQPQAVAEMVRVVRPGGRLLLADHIGSSSRLVRAFQSVLEKATIPLAGERWVHRPRKEIEAAGLEVESSQRFNLGLVERLVARKPEDK
ncbi:methyltransferase domain-containing protein [Allosaccharopolyspora coralli]|uniref:Methyltransferase domain-containing protein n=1 Tax=Allosaccharopolyspora coralli TaxID=2665642 RepID=A0A5Q3Q3X2_9PSEU|nr:class I SAM-dependent methyltransferase [Allosaccharopolyspora coralli]QGK69142.1 methyltransferase domain-containing protein [Allosaccharopolyspora coralli]